MYFYLAFVLFCIIFDIFIFYLLAILFLSLFFYFLFFTRILLLITKYHSHPSYLLLLLSHPPNHRDITSLTASPTPPTPMSPIYIQWYTNNQALTWTLLHTLQEFPHCRNVLWPLGTSCNHPSCLNIAASILSQSVFMPNALYSNALAADPEHYHRSIKTKVTELGMLYSVLKQALITVGEARMDKELYGMLLEDVWTEYSR